MENTLLIIGIFSYLFGSIPFSYYIGRFYGKNLFQIGSKNIGTANVYRATKNFAAAALALIADMGKGYCALWMTCQIAPSVAALTLASFFVVLGHNWPLFLRLKGGRGLASLGGAMLFLNWKLLFLSLAIVILFILAVEADSLLKKEWPGKTEEKIKTLVKVLISQVKGRMIGMMGAVLFAFFFDFQTLKIITPALILVGVKHIKRTKSFIEKNNKK
ncbi:MAG: hypothetical protein GF370_01950 [Candidatus Nealsonbacteria bacterium]|nr:hypothetical protein [Candidatus Nealsonbacteria bacterium]